MCVQGDVCVYGYASVHECVVSLHISLILVIDIWSQQS